MQKRKEMQLRYIYYILCVFSWLPGICLKMVYILYTIQWLVGGNLAQTESNKLAEVVVSFWLHEQPVWIPWSVLLSDKKRSGEGVRRSCCDNEKWRNRWDVSVKNPTGWEASWIMWVSSFNYLLSIFVSGGDVFWWNWVDVHLHLFIYIYWNMFICRESVRWGWRQELVSWQVGVNQMSVDWFSCDLLHAQWIHNKVKCYILVRSCK